MGGSTTVGPRGRSSKQDRQDGGTSVSKANDEEIERLLMQAEQRGAFFNPPDKRLREALRRRARRGTSVVDAGHGAYARASYWTGLSRPERTRHLLRSLQELHPEWVFCRESAAAAWGLPVSYADLEAVHVATDTADRRGRYGNVAWHAVEDDDSVTVHGIRTTSLERTVFDCLRSERFGQGLAVADAALRIPRATRGGFIRYFLGMQKAHRGVWKAVRAMRLADPRSESGGESIARGAMIELGYALPELQVPFERPLGGDRAFRVDFLWTRDNGSGVIGEFDGMQKYENPAFRNGRSSVRTLADEQHREAQLSLYGMPIVRFAYRDVVQPGRLGRLLDLYGIPRSEEAARFNREAERRRLGTAVTFQVMRFDGPVGVSMPA